MRLVKSSRLKKTLYFHTSHPLNSMFLVLFGMIVFILLTNILSDINLRDTSEYYISFTTQTIIND